MAPILGIIASGNWAGANASSYESIATVTVGSGGTGTITFSSIPQTYTHLQIRYIARNAYTGGGAFTNSDMYINSDTTASHYTFHRLSSNGTSASADSAANAGSIYVFATNANAPSNVFGAGIIDILNYTSTNTYKTIRISDGYDGNGSGWIDAPRSGAWLSTSAITSFSISNPGSSNWNQYSTFALYGIKG